MFSECVLNMGYGRHSSHLKSSLGLQYFSLPVSHVRFHIVQAAHYAVQLLTLAVQDSGYIVEMLLGIGHQTS